MVTPYPNLEGEEGLGTHFQEKQPQVLDFRHATPLALHIQLRLPETDMRNTTILRKYVAQAYCSANFTLAKKFVSITY